MKKSSFAFQSHSNKENVSLTHWHHDHNLWASISLCTMPELHSRIVDWVALMQQLYALFQGSTTHPLSLCLPHIYPRSCQPWESHAWNLIPICVWAQFRSGLWCAGRGGLNIPVCHFPSPQQSCGTNCLPHRYICSSSGYETSSDGQIGPCGKGNVMRGSLSPLFHVPYSQTKVGPSTHLGIQIWIQSLVDSTHWVHQERMYSGHGPSGYLSLYCKGFWECNGFSKRSIKGLHPLKKKNTPKWKYFICKVIF